MVPRIAKEDYILTIVSEIYRINSTHQMTPDEYAIASYVAAKAYLLYNPDISDREAMDMYSTIQMLLTESDLSGSSNGTE